MAKTLSQSGLYIGGRGYWDDFWSRIDPSTPAGSHFVDVSYSGDAKYGTANGQLKLPVNRIATTTSMKVSTTTIPFGSEQKGVFSVTIRSAKIGVVPGGSVTVLTGTNVDAA